MYIVKILCTMWQWFKSFVLFFSTIQKWRYAPIEWNRFWVFFPPQDCTKSLSFVILNVATNWALDHSVRLQLKIFFSCLSSALKNTVHPSLSGHSRSRMSTRCAGTSWQAQQLQSLPLPVFERDLYWFPCIVFPLCISLSNRLILPQWTPLVFLPL